MGRKKRIKQREDKQKAARKENEEFYQNGAKWQMPRSLQKK